MGSMCSDVLQTLIHTFASPTLFASSSIIDIDFSRKLLSEDLEIEFGGHPHAHLEAQYKSNFNFCDASCTHNNRDTHVIEHRSAGELEKIKHYGNSNDSVLMFRVTLSEMTSQAEKKTQFRHSSFSKKNNHRPFISGCICPGTPSFDLPTPKFARRAPFRVPGPERRVIAFRS